MVHNHPNRNLRARMRAILTDGERPEPDWILGARLNAGITQQQCADALHVPLRTWQQWEYGERSMMPALWATFRAFLLVESRREVEK